MYIWITTILAVHASLSVIRVRCFDCILVVNNDSKDSAGKTKTKWLFIKMHVVINGNNLFWMSWRETCLLCWKLSELRGTLHSKWSKSQSVLSKLLLNCNMFIEIFYIHMMRVSLDGSMWAVKNTFIFHR